MATDVAVGGAVVGVATVAGVGEGLGVGIVAGSVGVFPHPTNSKIANSNPMVWGNRFLVLIFINPFLIEAILVDYDGVNITLPPNVPARDCAPTKRGCAPTKWGSRVCAPRSGVSH